MLIRKATLLDAPVVRDIIDVVYVQGGWADPGQSPDYVRSLLAAEERITEAHVLLALAAGTPIATATATTGPPWANVARDGELEVRMLGVLPAARRSGAATALMAACEDLARDLGAQRVVLSTEPAMTAAQRLYDRLGYVRTPERDWSIGTFPLLTYGKDLAQAATT